MSNMFVWCKILLDKDFKTMYGFVKGFEDQIAIRCPESYNDKISVIKRGELIEFDARLSGYSIARKFFVFDKRF